MAAFLKVDLLRAHAVPDLQRTVLGHAPARPFPRPMLTARWLLAPDGRLICRWQVDLSTPHGPPPH
jgi:hypothetical protein